MPVSPVRTWSARTLSKRDVAASPLAATPGEAAMVVDAARGLGLAAAFESQGHLAQRLVGRPFRQQVDGAADAAAARGSAVHEAAGAAKHLNPFEQFGSDELARQQPVQAVVGEVVR